MKENLEEEVLRLVIDNPGIKAKEIGIKLGIDKSKVNAILHSRLKGKVRQDKAYSWWPFSPSSASGGGLRTEPPKLNTPLARLCRYYLDCLSHDDQGGISLFATSQFEPDYLELPTMPLVDEGSSNFLDSENPRKMLNRIRRERNRMTLILGYPVLLTHLRARSGWEGFKVEPLLLFNFEEDASNRSAPPKLGDAPPHINFSALKSITGGEVTNIIEEAVYLSEELGLANAPYELPDVDDLAARLRTIRPEWDWLEEPDPKNLEIGTPLGRLTEPGIYNRAVLLIAERSHYTLGLETELSRLQSVQETSYLNTSLQSWLEGKTGHDQVAESQPLLELLPLNSEQRQAVQQALSQPLTVITGPPGTGKSQVVASILINATWQGKTVLFASKNNKAVDVVETRVNALGPRPVLLRLGANEYQAKLAEYLVSLLAASATQSDEAQFEEAARDYEQLRARFNQLEAKISETIRLRNEVDELEKRVEPIRAILGDKAFASFRRIDLKPCEAAYDDLSRSVKRASKREQTLAARVFWPFIRKERYRGLQEASVRFKGTANCLWLTLPRSEIDDLTVLEWERFRATARARINEASQVLLYFRKLAELNIAAPIEQSSEEKMKLAEEMEDTSSLIWEKWLRLQPKRLTQKERAIINEYGALLKMIIVANDSGQKLGSAVFQKYHQLFPQLTNILPCWAITSLSARGRLPFEPGFFDLLVIDEASQCDIASAIPLLFRAKRVVIIGDPKQLRHVSSLPVRLDRQLMEKHDLVDARASWAYSVNSAFDLASGLCRSEDIVSLRDHHRSHADIIEFSNRNFYEGRLRIATRYDRLKFINRDGPAIRWIDVRGKVRRPSSGGAINEEEARAVVTELERLVLAQNYQGSIGVEVHSGCNSSVLMNS